MRKSSSYSALLAVSLVAPLLAQEPGRSSSPPQAPVGVSSKSSGNARKADAEGDETRARADVGVPLMKALKEPMENLARSVQFTNALSTFQVDLGESTMTPARVDSFFSQWRPSIHPIQRALWDRLRIEVRDYARRFGAIESEGLPNDPKSAAYDAIVVRVKAVTATIKTRDGDTAMTGLASAFSGLLGAGVSMGNTMAFTLGDRADFLPGTNIPAIATTGSFSHLQNLPEPERVAIENAILAMRSKNASIQSLAARSAFAQVVQSLSERDPVAVKNELRLLKDIGSPTPRRRPVVLEALQAGFSKTHPELSPLTIDEFDAVFDAAVDLAARLEPLPDIAAKYGIGLAALTLKVRAQR